MIRSLYALAGMLAALLVQAAPADADRWVVTREDDGAAFYASAGPRGVPLILECGGKSPRGLQILPPPPLITRNGGIFVFIGDAVLGHPLGGNPRPVTTFDVDGAAYVLPDLEWDDYYGGYVQILDMDDPVFAAMQAGDTLTVRSGEGAEQAIPLTQARGTIRRMKAWCAARWQDARVAHPMTNGIAATATRSGADGAAPAPPGFTLADADRIAADVCGGPADIAPGGAVLARMDEDMAPDLVIDFGALTCLGQDFPMSRGAGFCGASLCSIRVYLTGGYADGAGPLEYLGMGATIRAGDHGRDEIVSVPALASCAALNLDPCQSVTRVAGGDFVQ